MKNLSKVSALLMMFVFTVDATAVAKPDTPSRLIKDATEQLVEALQANRDRIREDRAVALRIANEIAIPLIDFSRASRSVLGRNWHTATQVQRDRFTRAFRNMLESVYVAAMIMYADDIISAARNISYPPSKFLGDSRLAVVKTVIDLRSGIKASVDYKMHQVEGEWKVYDVSVLGISLAKIYRATFARELRRQGIDGLISALEARTEVKTASASSP